MLPVASTWSQKTGFYGKKAFVEFSGTGALPLINNWYADYNYYEKSGAGVVEGKDRFNAGFYGGIGIMADPNVAFSFTAGLSYFNANGPQSLYYQDGDDFNVISVNHENLKIRSLTFMPIMHFATNKSTILPAGFSHEIGFGFVRTKVLENDYSFEGSDYNGNQVNYNGKTYDLHDFMDSVVSVNGDYIDYTKAYKGYTLMYGLKMRTPVGKQLMINYGIRYTINIAPRDYRFNSTPNSYDIALNDQIAGSVRSTRLRSFCALQLGLTYLF
ncbi:MAG: hypothetical protein A3E30_09120 [Fluviicola sp. RIFCSPHIGHO2_12_FULL_43_24]|nr:MAG: hypothetical protein A3E30_09120 [Fluviicola sp. RIFCSPHIGHO2_12_FULL_43_24]